MEPRFQQPPASEPRGTCAGRCTGRPVRRCGRGIPKGCCRFSLRPLKNAQAGGRWPNRHASATAERWSKTGPGPPGEELCPSRKAHSGRKAVTWGITRGCSAAVWRSARQFLPDRTDGEPRAAVASSGGPGHQLSYLRGAETALLSCRTVARQVRSQLCIEEQRQVIAAFATGPFDVASLLSACFFSQIQTFGAVPMNRLVYTESGAFDDSEQ